MDATACRTCSSGRACSPIAGKPLPAVQKDTPQPADADIKIVDFKEIKVYVRTFSGFATESTILDNAHSLFDTLKDDDQDFDTDVSYKVVPLVLTLYVK